jgi:hypothetical protein
MIKLVLQSPITFDSVLLLIGYGQQNAIGVLLKAGCVQNQN